MLKYHQENMKETSEKSKGDIAEKEFISRNHFMLFAVILMSSITDNNSILNIQLRITNVWPFFSYVVMYALVGIPLVLCQILLGQYGKVGNILVWRISPLFRGLGYSMQLYVLIMAVYHSRFLGVGLLYIKESLDIKHPVKWSNCSLYDSGVNCTDKADNETKIMTCCTFEEELDGECQIFNQLNYVSFDFYMNYMHGGKKGILGYMTGDLSPLASLTVAVAIIWFMAFVFMTRSMHTLTKIVSKMFTVSLVAFGLLFFSTILTQGHHKGIKSVIRLEFDHLFTIEMWSSVFLSMLGGLAAGTGTIITLSSFRSREAPVQSDALKVCVFKILLLISYNIWSIMMLGVVETRYEIEDMDCLVKNTRKIGANIVLATELGLNMFSPHAFALVYFLLFFLCFECSHFAILMYLFHVANGEIHPALKRHRTLSAGIFCIIAFFLSLLTLNKDAINFSLLLREFTLKMCNVLLVSIFAVVAFVLYGVRTLCNDFEFMLGYQISQYVRYMWYILVLLIGVFGFNTLNTVFAWRASSVLLRGYFGTVNRSIILITFSPIVIIALLKYVMYMRGQRTKDLFRMEKEWGPTSLKEKMVRKYFNPERAVHYRSPVLKCSHNCLLQSKELKAEIHRLRRKRKEFFKFIKSREGIHQ